MDCEVFPWRGCVIVKRAGEGWEVRMKRMMRLGLAVVLVVAVQGGVAQTAKIGTFDRTSIVVAFYGSPMWSEKLKAVQAEQDKAKAAGDRKKVAELNKWGKDQQTLAHKQMAGSTNIDNIMETMKPMFTAVEAQAQVTTIVPEGARIDKSAAKADVTDLLMDQLQANARTRQSALELRNFKKEHPVKYRLTMFLFRFDGD